MLRVSMSFIGFTAVVFPLFGAVFAANTNRWDPILNYPGSKEEISLFAMAVLCVGDSLFKYMRINRPGSDVRFSSGARVEQLHGGLLDIKKFQVYNFLPSISAAIGGFTPQRYVWRICIALQLGLRFLLVGCYYHWLTSINMGEHKTVYQRLVKVAIGCHIAENLALLTLTCVSSTENFTIHENSFIVFIVCSQVYMLLSCCLIYWSHKAGYINVTEADRRCLCNKVILFLVNLCIFLLSVYLYFRHNTYCEPKIYSWFALGEYLTVLSNIAFHGLCIVDFRDYSFTVLPTEELEKPPFKDK